jgi:hypothetical protein
MLQYYVFLSIIFRVRKFHCVLPDITVQSLITTAPVILYCYMSHNTCSYYFNPSLHQNLQAVHQYKMKQYHLLHSTVHNLKRGFMFAEHVTPTQHPALQVAINSHRYPSSIIHIKELESMNVG